ncbi:MAG: glycoside hydrolase, partial [Armatimonadetes bacterium]|nr:glycoside hydrolase [Candidatus Hippobium faecium]
NYTQVRYDFYYLTTELFKEAFTHQYYDWCKENNLILTGHFMCEDYLWFQTQWSGDVMSHYEYMTWPGVDKLYTHLKQNATFKQVSSVCEQLGKERTFAEIFALMGNHTAFKERKWVGDWCAALGNNFINSHLSLYSMRGERKRDCPANYYYQQPWWDEEKTLGDYFARLCAFGCEGERPVDLMVLQPLTSVWCEYSPLQAKYEYGPVLKYDKPYEQLSERFMDEKLDYHFGNENLMKKYASVDGDAFVIGKCRYKAVYVPPCSNIMKSTYELLKEYSENGGKLIFTNELPYMIEGVPSDISFDNYEVARDVEDAINMLKKYIACDIEILDARVAENEARIFGAEAAKVWCEKRVAGNSSRYFLCNTNKDRNTEIFVKFRENPDAPVAFYDMVTGKMYKAP